MGREIRRVPLDFAWPLNEVWDGFVNPHYRDCPAACEGGYSVTYRALSKHVNALVWDRRVQTDPQYAAITTFLSGREPVGGALGHDSCDAYAATKKLGEMAGLPDGWHKCPVCEGEGTDPATRAAYEAWTQTEPPEGEGWQMWETVSEGSPVSPVFKTAGGLIVWLTNHEGYSREAARNFVNAGWAPSGVSIPGIGYMDGVAASEYMHGDE